MLYSGHTRHSEMVCLSVMSR